MKKWAPVFIMVAAVLWSLDGLLRRQLYSIPTPTVVMVEHILGVLLLPIWFESLACFKILPRFKTFWPEYRRMNTWAWVIMLLTAMVGGVLGTMFYTQALSRIHYINYSVVILLQKTQPLFAIGLAALVLKEKLSTRYLFLAGIGLLAAYVISFPDLVPNLQQSNDELIAALLALGAAFCWGSATVLGKLILHQLSFGAATFMRFALVIPIAFFIGIALQQSQSIQDITSQQWYCFLGIACTSGTLAFLLYYKGLQYTPARIATFAEMMFPISAIFLGFFFLNEVLTIQQMIAAISLLSVIVALSLETQANGKNIDQQN